MLDTYGSWRGDRTIRLGAGLAYYGLFSLASVLTLSLGIVRVLGRRSEIELYLSERFENAFGQIGVEAAELITKQLDGTAGAQLGLIGLGSLLVTGSLFFLALEDALNQIWGVPVRLGFRSTIRRRLVAFLVLLLAALTLVASLAVQTVTSLFQALVPGSVVGFSALWSLVASLLSWSILAGALVLLFRFLPSAGIPWRPAIISGVVSAALLVVGTALVGHYLRTFGASSLSGAASSLLAVLVWIFYEAQILLAGAQLSKTLTGPRSRAETDQVDQVRP
ncbi:MAG: YihY/virulence factor BrkB family protein [Acidimicrobiia bacterium]|nr:YihY/virulence factor BrkB family protein [Acidimicrobiia bacterium]